MGQLLCGECTGSYGVGMIVTAAGLVLLRCGRCCGFGCVGKAGRVVYDCASQSRCVHFLLLHAHY